MSAANKVDVADVRKGLEPLGFADASIQESTQGGKKLRDYPHSLNTSDQWRNR
jgi:hypothetical protein